MALIAPAPDSIQAPACRFGDVLRLPSAVRLIFYSGAAAFHKIAQRFF
jgi:hypothetical protein